MKLIVFTLTKEEKLFHMLFTGNFLFLIVLSLSTEVNFDMVASDKKLHFSALSLISCGRQFPLARLRTGSLLLLEYLLGLVLPDALKGDGDGDEDSPNCGHGSR